MICKKNVNYEILVKVCHYFKRNGVKDFVTTQTEAHERTQKFLEGALDKKCQSFNTFMFQFLLYDCLTVFLINTFLLNYKKYVQRGGCLSPQAPPWVRYC